MQLSPAEIKRFQQTVLTHYQDHGRHDLPWRQPGSDGRFDPYRILVSELMLQQTQVSRVIPKFAAFLDTFPSAAALARAPLSAVLIAWQGLGYNRRAKFLWQAAQMIDGQWQEKWPRTVGELVALPGVGVNTAGAIAAYAFDVPVVFIETNIRSVVLHHFFKGQTDVPDSEVTAVMEQTLPEQDWRGWYWALMDYGTFLKQTVGNTARASRSYAKQSAFKGSRRAVRGAVLRELATGPVTRQALSERVADERLDSVLDDLAREQLIIGRDDTIMLYS